MGTGAGGSVDELEELADRINKAATTLATTERGDPLPDWLQPFDENLANNEGDVQKKGEQEAAAPFAPSSAAGATTMPDDDDELSPVSKLVSPLLRVRGRERDHRRRLEGHVEEILEYHLDHCFSQGRDGSTADDPRGCGEVQPYEEGGGGPVEGIHRNVCCTDGLGIDQRVWRQGQGCDCED